jgi:hypothetical protein
MEDILKKIHQKTGVDLAHLLGREIPGSQLNSLLLAVFDEKTASLSPSDLLRLYKTNRFVKPAQTPVIRLRKQELESLQLLSENGFEPLDLSPVSMLGTCSTLGTVSQNKIISATRGTEVLADATNAMAMHIAYLRKFEGNKEPLLQFCTTHRHIRTPEVKVEGFTAHFKIACMVSSGKDTGNYTFEKQTLFNHFQSLQQLLKQLFNTEVKYFKLQSRSGYPDSQRLIREVLKETEVNFPVVSDAPHTENNYYQGLQFKAVITIGKKEIEIADGGFVNWTSQLLESKKERLLISGLGLEYLTTILN